MEVRDLFFNVPARRKFLRTPRTEFRYAEDIVCRLALARPDVTFVLRHDARKAIEATRRMEPTRRVARLLGDEFARSALDIAFDAGEISMHGFLALPSAARARADLQYLFVNGRSVRDDVVRHAVRVGFGDLLASAMYPAFVLHLGIEPAAVDVNVHPTKHEVRFREPRHVHDFVRHAVARALGESDMGILPLEAPAVQSEPGTAPPVASPVPVSAASASGHASGLRGGEARVGEHPAAYAPLTDGARSATYADACRLHLGSYVLAEGRGELLLIELETGRRALVHERLNESTRTRSPVSRPLLIPQSRTVPESTADAVDAASASLRSLGIEVRRGAPGSVTLRALPTCLAGVAPEGLLDTVAGWAKGKGSVEHLVTALAVLAGSSPFDGDIDDIVDAALGGRLGAGVVAIDEAMLRQVSGAASRR